MNDGRGDEGSRIDGLSTPKSKQVDSWARVRTVFSGLSTATMIGFFIWFAVTRADDVKRENVRFEDLNLHVEKVEKELVQQRTTAWVSADGVTHNCLATNDQATCTVTNMREEPITTCVRGVLKKKEPAGATLSSLPMCTGRLGPRETRTISVPWSGGFARDLCSKKTYYGETLDWEQCEFKTEAVEPPTDSKKASAPTKSSTAL